MPDRTTTIREWPPLDAQQGAVDTEVAEEITAPGLGPSLASRVLDEARALIGRKEEGGQNRGEIVELVCAPFLSPERFARALAAGKLRWCAAFASYCWWRVEPRFRGVASTDCDALWLRHSDKGWSRRSVSAEGRAIDPPQPGDIIFFSSKRDAGDLVHVGLVEAVGLHTLQTIEGNARVRQDDSTGQVARKHYSLSDPRIWGYSTPRFE